VFPFAPDSELFCIFSMSAGYAFLCTLLNIPQMR